MFMSLLSVLYRCKHVCMYLRQYAWIHYIISTDSSNSITCYFIIIKTRPPNNYFFHGVISGYYYTQNSLKQSYTDWLPSVCVNCCLYLPHAGFFPIHYSHVVDFVLLDAPLLRLIQLLRNKAHEWVVWCVSWMYLCVWVCVSSTER